MKMFSKEHRSARFARYGFVNLLVWLFVYLVLGPFFGALPYVAHLMALLLTVVMLSAVGTMTATNKFLHVSLALLVVAVALTWLQSLGLLHFALDVSSAGLVVFLIPLIYSFGSHIFKAKSVTGNIICCALCLYLLIGLLWGGLFSILESVQPGSFAGALLEGEKTIDEKSHHLHYLSFVTISTLGYGDITPQTRAAAALCQTEAIVGQFYAMVILARLVGIQVAQDMTKKP